MTVKELIEHLKTFPEDQLVVFGTSCDFHFGSGDVLNITNIFEQEFDDWDAINHGLLSNPNCESPMVKTCMIWSESVYSSCISCEVVIRTVKE